MVADVPVYTFLSGGLDSSILTVLAKRHADHLESYTIAFRSEDLALEAMPEVVRYVKNHNLGFTIPYTLNGEEHQYTPDFIACIDDGQGPEDLLNLLLEVTGEKKKDKAAKVATARNLWVPAVNNHGGFGRWRFVEQCGQLEHRQDSEFRGWHCWPDFEHHLVCQRHAR